MCREDNTSLLYKSVWSSVIEEQWMIRLKIRNIKFKTWLIIRVWTTNSMILFGLTVIPDDVLPAAHVNPDGHDRQPRADTKLVESE